MKNIFLLLLFTLHCIIAFAGIGGTIKPNVSKSYMDNSVARKIALIINISKYSYNRGWPELDNKNDIKILDSCFRLQGFRQIQYNTGGTKNDIIKSLKNFKDSLRAGDIAFLFYIGHGAEIYLGGG